MIERPTLAELRTARRLYNTQAATVRIPFEAKKASELNGFWIEAWVFVPFQGDPLPADSEGGDID